MLSFNCVAAGFVACFCLAGCGGGGGKETKTTAAPATKTTAPTAAPKDYGFATAEWYTDSECNNKATAPAVPVNPIPLVVGDCGPPPYNIRNYYSGKITKCDGNKMEYTVYSLVGCTGTATKLSDEASGKCVTSKVNGFGVKITCKDASDALPAAPAAPPSLGPSAEWYTDSECNNKATAPAVPINPIPLVVGVCGLPPYNVKGYVSGKITKCDGNKMEYTVYKLVGCIGSGDSFTDEASGKCVTSKVNGYGVKITCSATTFTETFKLAETAEEVNDTAVV